MKMNKNQIQNFFRKKKTNRKMKRKTKIERLCEIVAKKPIKPIRLNKL